jgi:hypothetical protein
MSQAQSRIEQPSQQHPQWDIPKDLSTYSPVVTAIGVTILFLWRKYGQRWYDQRKVQMMRPYKIAGQIDDNMQVVRAMSNAHRAMLLEVDTKANNLSIINQTVMDSGISELALEFSDDQAECIKAISNRFKDQNFIAREVSKIPEGIYRGFMLQRGIEWVIYCKLGEYNSVTWFIALHYRYETYANYETASEKLRQPILDIGSAIFSLLLQKP